MNQLRHLLVCLPLASFAAGCDSPATDAPDQLRKGFASPYCAPAKIDLTADWSAEYTLETGEGAPRLLVRTELEPVDKARFVGTIAVYNADQLRIVLDVHASVDAHGGVAIWGSDGTAYDLDGDVLPSVPRVVLAGHPSEEGLSLSGNIHGFDEPILFVDDGDVIAFDEPVLFFDEPILFFDEPILF